MQKKLAELGFGPGPIDGIYGPITRWAVMQYQKSRGLVIL
ncbi:peptidoglycan-binding domain-containing protein [Desulfolucanica intricata]|nr:peptidoglycan-binding domain-containing protein [Desulfolucanica intricata]